MLPLVNKLSHPWRPVLWYNYNWSPNLLDICGTYAKPLDVIDDCCKYYDSTPNTKGSLSLHSDHTTVYYWRLDDLHLSYGGVNVICQLIQSNTFWFIRLGIDFLLIVWFAILGLIFRYELWHLFFRDSGNITADISYSFTIQRKLRVVMIPTSSSMVAPVVVFMTNNHESTVCQPLVAPDTIKSVPWQIFMATHVSSVTIQLAS